MTRYERPNHWRALLISSLTIRSALDDLRISAEPETESGARQALEALSAQLRSACEDLQALAHMFEAR
jgi:hypothetical protein